MEKAEIYRRVLELLEQTDDLLQNLATDEYEYLIGKPLESLPNKIENRLHRIENGMRSDWERATNQTK